MQRVGSGCMAGQAEAVNQVVGVAGVESWVNVGATLGKSCGATGCGPAVTASTCRAGVPGGSLGTARPRSGHVLLAVLPGGKSAADGTCRQMVRTCADISPQFCCP